MGAQTELPENGRAVTTCLHPVDGNTSVLLQTTQGLARRPNNPDGKVKVRVIFDSCSQRSYVSQRLHGTLQLPVIGSHNLLIKAFGDESPRLRSCELVQLSITSIDGMELYVNAYCVPTICSPLSDQAVRVAVQNYPHLQGLELADVPNKPGEVEVDVLIGADYYWNFFTGVARKGEKPGPVALQS